MSALELNAISKRFGAIHALTDVSLRLQGGEVVGLMGDNGAGKSTLVKIIAGNFPPSGGTMKMDGRAVAFHKPSDARDQGVEIVYQDLALCDNLSAAENVFLGREPMRRFGPLRWVDYGTMRRRAGELDPGELVGRGERAERDRVTVGDRVDARGAQRVDHRGPREAARGQPRRVDPQREHVELGRDPLDDRVDARARAHVRRGRQIGDQLGDVAAQIGDAVGRAIAWRAADRGGASAAPGAAAARPAIEHHRVARRLVVAPREPAAARAARRQLPLGLGGQALALVPTVAQRGDPGHLRDGPPLEAAPRHVLAAAADEAARRVARVQVRQQTYVRLGRTQVQRTAQSPHPPSSSGASHPGVARAVCKAKRMLPVFVPGAAGASETQVPPGKKEPPTGSRP